ncbi:MAG TPA: DUF1028 domain-containing protein [Chloroflexota bacterium]|nr:DUF1028 domain-containing protein [Chloroflexota bacterium]
MRPPLVSTYSIVARDPENGDLGVAVQSKFLAVGAVVPWARAGVGAIATQARANTIYGPNGLHLLRHGVPAQQTINQLIAGDEDRAQRQVGIVDAHGNAATYTGSACQAWAGGRTGSEYAAQGNILVSQATVDALAETFEATTGTLAARLLAALAAGQAAGGDRRGMQSAAILVVRANGGYNGFNDRYIDLRVDDHPAPIEELRRLMVLHQLYLEPTAPGAAIPLTEALIREIQTMLAAAGEYHDAPTGIGDQATEDALQRYVGRENLEMREATLTSIDPRVLEYMRAHYRAPGA